MNKVLRGRDFGTTEQSHTIPYRPYAVSYTDCQGGVIGVGFCRYDITTALTLSMNEDSTCLASSEIRELAKLIQEQYSASQAHHFSFIIKPHIENIIPGEINGFSR
uniref:Uncharacterized protein n=1 Tax=Anopheles culicifacies TaxID=139723 RepID=A0A182MTL5_9DIPT